VLQLTAGKMRMYCSFSPLYRCQNKIDTVEGNIQCDSKRWTKLNSNRRMKLSSSFLITLY